MEKAEVQEPSQAEVQADVQDQSQAEVQAEQAHTSLLQAVPDDTATKLAGKYSSEADLAKGFAELQAKYTELTGKDSEISGDGDVADLEKKYKSLQAEFTKASQQKAKLPEQYDLDAEKLGLDQDDLVGVNEAFKEVGLTQEQANKMAELYASKIADFTKQDEVDKQAEVTKLGAEAQEVIGALHRVKKALSSDDQYAFESMIDTADRARIIYNLTKSNSGRISALAAEPQQEDTLKAGDYMSQHYSAAITPGTPERAEYLRLLRQETGLKKTG